MHRQVIVNSSAESIFQVIGDVAAYTDWTGYGVKSITLDSSSSSSSQFGSTLAHYEAGLYGFAFLFSLKWNFYYANHQKPYYAAFKLYQRTPLIEDIQGEYCIQPISNASSALSITVYAKMSGLIPGFIQNKLKHLIVDLALLDLKTFCDSSEKMKRFRSKSLPSHMILPREEIEDSDSLQKSPWSRFRKVLQSTSRTLTDVFTLQEPTFTYRFLFYSFKASEMTLSILDILSLPQRLSTFRKKLIEEYETMFRFSEQALSVFDLHRDRLRNFTQNSSLSEYSGGMIDTLKHESLRNKDSMLIRSYALRVIPKFRFR